MSEQKDWIDVDRLLACIHCGLCLPSCPTHVLSGEEMPSPRGRLYLMRAVQEGRLDVHDEAFARHELSCLVCRACETACPSGVEFGYLMEQTRAKLEQTRPMSALRRYLYTGLLRSRTTLDALQRALAAFTRLGGASVAYTLGREIRGVMPRTSAMLRLTPKHVQAPRQRTAVKVSAFKGSVALLVGCIGDTFTSEVNDATIRLLTWLGYDVLPITSETCCGALAIHAGYRQEAIQMAASMAKVEEATRADFIVSNIAGCGAMLKDYKHLLPSSPERDAFLSKVRDITEFLAEHALPELSRLHSKEPIDAAYQAPCHLLHAQKVTEAPLRVIAAIGNVTVHPLAENELCCGSAGTYNIEHPKEADALLARKVGAVRSDGARIILTANAGCLMQLRKGLREDGVDRPVYHIVEWLASLLPTAR